MRLEDAKLEVLSRDPQLARAFLHARSFAPHRAGVELLVVRNEEGKLVEVGPPTEWAPGLAKRVLAGELAVSCERYFLSEEGRASGLEPPPRRRHLSGSGLGRLKVGVHADRGGCSHMEDESAVYLPAGGDFAFVCVYDGHGGAHAAQFLKEQLHFNVMASEEFAAGHIGAALRDGFRKTEADLLAEQGLEHRRFYARLGREASHHSCEPQSPWREPLIMTGGVGASNPGSGAGSSRGSVAGSISGSGSFADRSSGSGAGRGSGLPALPPAEDYVSAPETCTPASCSGSTALMLLIHSEQFHLAWLGDCRAVLCRGGKAAALTADHSLRCEAERKRVLADGGRIEGDRLCGFLEVARAFGDLDGETGKKPPGLSSQPDVHSQPIHPEDEFVVLGSDGLWSVLDVDDAIRLARDALRAYGDAAMASEKLVEVALKRNADDNITAMVVWLSPIPEAAEERRPRLALKKKSAA